MGLHQQIAPIQEPGSEACVTVGTFDGVHKGHQALLHRLVSVAQQNDARSVALSFSQPPRSVIEPTRQTPHLYDAKTRAALIREQGIDAVQLIDFDDEIRVMSTEKFLTTLQSSLGMTDLIIGEGAVMGHDRQDVDRIAEIANRNGFQLHTVPPVIRKDQIVLPARWSAQPWPQAMSNLPPTCSDASTSAAVHVYRGSARAREDGCPHRQHGNGQDNS